MTPWDKPPHPDERHLKRWGVSELLKDSHGREIVKRIQKYYEIDLLQPDDPRFEHYYGDIVRERERQTAINEQKAKDMWAERQERRKYSKRV